VAALVMAAATCARDGNAQMASERVPVAPDDTTALNRVLNVVRGVDPLLCELATRSVDMHGSWSNWGSLGGNPLETDSAASALIKWIQHEHNDPAVVPRLRAAIRDPDACVRRIGASFLGRVDHPNATEALLAALADARAETRSAAALGLGLSEKAVALQPLIRRLTDDSPAVRRAAAWALGEMEDATALEPLMTVLARDPDPRVRQIAAWAIGQVDK
jgi:HEAT repeat protein